MNIQKSLYTARCAGAHSDSQALPCKEQENPSLEACPTSQGWTDRRKQLQKWLPSNIPFLHDPGQGSQLNSRYTGKEKGIQDFLLPRKTTFFPPSWGEGVGSPVSHPGSHKGYSSLTEQAQKETQSLPKHTPPTCELGRNAGKGSWS